MIMWLSECCEAPPLGDALSAGIINYNYTVTGVCGRCWDRCVFFVEDPGEPFDTNEEKHGER